MSRKKNNSKKEKFSLFTKTLDGSYVKDNVRWTHPTLSTKCVAQTLERHKEKNWGF